MFNISGQLLKHPNIHVGHTLNKGQRPMYQGVCCLESPLYVYGASCILHMYIICSALLTNPDLKIQINNINMSVSSSSPCVFISVHVESVCW